MDYVRLVEITNKWMLRILKIAYLNLLWFLTTLLGLVVVGVGPATVALHSVYRQWFDGKEDLHVRKTFWKFYKENFKEAAILGAIYFIAGYILIIDLLVVKTWFVRYLIYIGVFIYLVSLIYLPGLVSHYEKVTIPKRIKMSLVLGFVYLQYTLVLLVVLITTNFLAFNFAPGLSLFFGTSASALFNVWLNRMVFKRVDATMEYAESEQKKY